MLENTKNFLKAIVIGLITIAVVSLISVLPVEKNMKLALMVIVGFVGLAISNRALYGNRRYPSVTANKLSEN